MLSGMTEGWNVSFCLFSWVILICKCTVLIFRSSVLKLNSEFKIMLAVRYLVFFFLSRFEIICIWEEENIFQVKYLFSFEFSFLADS